MHSTNENSLFQSFHNDDSVIHIKFITQNTESKLNWNNGLLEVHDVSSEGIQSSQKSSSLEGHSYTLFAFMAKPGNNAIWDDYSWH